MVMEFVGDIGNYGGSDLDQLHGLELNASRVEGR